MGNPRLAITEFLLALRWPGAAGALLLLASLACVVAVLLPARDQVNALEARADRAERRAAAIRNGTEAAPQSAATRREQFYGALPAQPDIADQIGRIYAAAQAEQLALLHGEYAGAEVASTGLVRYKIVLPLKGSYGQVRRFLTAATAAVPGLTLDDLALRRHSVADTQVEARVQLSLFLAKR
jgi:hypothetical protein